MSALLCVPVELIVLSVKQQAAGRRLLGSHDTAPADFGMSFPARSQSSGHGNNGATPVIPIFPARLATRIDVQALDLALLGARKAADGELGQTNHRTGIAAAIRDGAGVARTRTIHFPTHHGIQRPEGWWRYGIRK